MENKQSVPQQRTKDFWVKAVARIEAGELTVTDFCQREGVSPKTYFYWKGKIKRESANTFFPVRVSPESNQGVPGQGTSLEIVLRNKRIVRVTESWQNLSLLERVIKTLEGDAA